jgi:hypothetical protein
MPSKQTSKVKETRIIEGFCGFSGAPRVQTRVIEVEDLLFYKEQFVVSSTSYFEEVENDVPTYDWQED